MRREVSLAAAGTALLALASCAHRPPPSYPAPAPPPPYAAPALPPPYAAPAPAPLPAAAMPMPVAGRLSDRQFVDSAAASGMAEVELGRLALSRTAAPGVRSFARRMVDDHSRLNSQLMAVARRLDLPPPPGPTPAEQAAWTRLAAAPPSAFDRDYIDQQVRAHRQAIALFNEEAQGGQNPILRRLAQQALPILRSHLREAEAIAGGVG